LKTKLIPVLSVLLMLLLTSSASAASMEVNGNPFNSADSFAITDGSSFIELSLLESFLGTAVEISDNTAVIMKNDTTLEITAGSTLCKLNGSDYTLPYAPYMHGEGLMVPLRTVCTLLGADIGWNADTSTIIITFEEKINEMSADEMLAASNAKMYSYNTYQASGDMDISMSFAGIDDPEAPGDMQMNSLITAQYQIDPLAFYTRQEMNMSAIPEMPLDEPIISESLLLDGSLYSNMPELGWVKLDYYDGDQLESIMDQYSSQDPATMLSQMKDFGIITSFAGESTIDITSFAGESTIDDNKYWVINATIDPELYMSKMGEVMESSDIGGMGDLFSLLFGNINYDFSYRVYVNQETLLSDKMIMDCSIGMNMPNPENPDEVVSINMDMSGDFNYYGFGEPLELPDIDFGSVPDMESSEYESELL